MTTQSRAWRLPKGFDTETYRYCYTSAVTGCYAEGTFGHEVCAHSYLQDTILAYLGPDEERAVIAKTARGWRYGLRNIGREFADAKKAGNKLKMAQIAVGVVIGLCKVTSVKAVVQLVFGTMTKKDWIKSGAIVLAQLAIWFGTAGASIVAQLALLMLGAADLIEDSVKLAKLMES